jgi:hypothetical protein
VHTLKPEFTFAGFTWPRYVANLPAGPFSARIDRMRHPVTGGYYHAPAPNDRAGRGCYHESQGWPGLRWEAVGRTYRPDNWSGAELQGVVFRLPHGRGFLAGYSAGSGMYAGFDRDIYADESDASRAAESLAEDIAQREAEYQSEQCAETEENETLQEAV